MSIEEPRSQPMPPELEARLRPGARKLKAGSGNKNTEYIEVVERVHVTHEGRMHLERDLPHASTKHVEYALRKQADEHGFDVAVGYSDEHGVYAIYAGRDGLTDGGIEVEVGTTPEPDDDSQAPTDE